MALTPTDPNAADQNTDLSQPRPVAPTNGMQTTDAWGSMLPAGIGNSQQAMQATAAMRQSPWYQQWMQENGINPQTGQNQYGNVSLTSAQQQSLLNAARQNGIGISNSYQIDQNGQIAQQPSHLLRNILLGAAAGGLALTGIGAAGIGPMAGLFGAGADAAAAGGAGLAAGTGADAAGAAALTGGIGDLTGLGGMATLPSLGAAGAAGAGDAITGVMNGLPGSGTSLPTASGDFFPTTQISAAEPTTVTGPSMSTPTGWTTSVTTPQEAEDAATAEEQGLSPLSSTPIGSGANSTIMPAITGAANPNVSGNLTNTLIQRILQGVAPKSGSGNSGSTSGASDLSTLLGGLAHGIQNNRLQTGNLATQYDNAAVNAQNSANVTRNNALKNLAQSSYILNGGYKPQAQTVTLNGKQMVIPQLLQPPSPSSQAQMTGAQNLQNTAEGVLAPGGTVSPIPFSSYGTPGTGETIAQAGSAVAGLLPTVGKIFGWF